ncbi:MAG: hypothetical protein WKG00_30880 [Polyangiaceae bacterium]
MPLFAVALCSLVVACGSTPGPLEPRVPEYQPDQQAKSRVRRDPLQPLIVASPAAARAELEAEARRGLVAVRYDGSTLEVLPRCHAEGSYTYAGTSVHRDSLVIRDRDQLAAELPLGVASLSGKLEQAGRLQVEMAVVGAYALDRDTVTIEASEACAEATHYVSALIAGAFEISAGGSTAASAGVDVQGAGMRGGHTASREVINRAGSIGECRVAQADEQGPPPNCSALVRVSLVRLARKPAPDPAEAAVPGVVDPGGAPPDTTGEPPVGASEPGAPGAAPGASTGEDSGRAAPGGLTRTDPEAWTPPDTPSAPPPAGGTGLGTWGYVGIGVGLAALIGVVVAGVIVQSNKQEPQRGPVPEGGLGSGTLSGAGFRW